MLDRVLVLQFFEVIVQFFEVIGNLCIFGNQYIVGKVSSWSVILRTTFLQYLIKVPISYFLDFCICEYVDVDVFLFGETAANNIEM